MRFSIGEFIGPRIVHCQCDSVMSSESTKPKLTDISAVFPFSMFSSSSRSLKFRGTMTTSPEDAIYFFACRSTRKRGCVAARAGRGAARCKKRLRVQVSRRFNFGAVLSV